MSAQQERDKFWSYFDNYLHQQGWPFYVCHEKGGKNQAAGNINTHNPMDMQTICCEFKYMEQVVLVQVYINNNIPLYDYLYRNKKLIESRLGYPVEWVSGGKISSHVRRIQKKFYIYEGDTYLTVIKQAFPYILDFIRVFEGYI